MHDTPDTLTFAPGAAWRIAWPIAAVTIGVAVLLVVAAIADGAGASADTTAAVATFTGSGVILIGGLLLVRLLPPAQRRVTIATKGRAWATAGTACHVRTVSTTAIWRCASSRAPVSVSYRSLLT